MSVFCWAIALLLIISSIYLLLDEHAWSNAGLDREDNAATLARILQRELQPGGVVAIEMARLKAKLSEA